MQREFGGEYSRHNEWYQQKWSLEGQLLEEHLAVENAAIMMYEPFSEAPKPEKPCADQN